MLAIPSLTVGVAWGRGALVVVPSLPVGVAVAEELGSCFASGFGVGLFASGELVECGDGIVGLEGGEGVGAVGVEAFCAVDGLLDGRAAQAAVELGVGDFEVVADALEGCVGVEVEAQESLVFRSHGTTVRERRAGARRDFVVAWMLRSGGAGVGIFPAIWRFES